ncbi:hypothetical protein [Deinococcus sp.]
MTTLRGEDGQAPAQEGFIPAGKLPLMAFLVAVLALVLLAGWLSRLI